MSVPKVWELIRCFKEECKSLGWKASADEDWVNVDNQYHNILWTRTIHPSTFRILAKSSKCAIRERVSYRVVSVAYNAWLFSQSPHEDIIRNVIADPVLAKTTAIYDLSCLHSGKTVCPRLNLTESRVFKEFEKFMEKKWGIEFQSVEGVLTTEV